MPLRKSSISLALALATLIVSSSADIGVGVANAQEKLFEKQSSEQTFENDDIVWIPVFSQYNLRCIGSCEKKDVSCVLPSRSSWNRHGYHHITTFTGSKSLTTVVPESVGNIITKFTAEDVEIRFEYVEPNESTAEENIRVCYCPL